MAMEDEDVGSLADRTDAQTGAKKGGEPGDAGTCIDRQPDAVIHPAGRKQTAGRGSRSGPGAHAATGIRVLKASHAAGKGGFWCTSMFRRDQGSDSHPQSGSRSG
ncbi:unnamed protein product [Tetraodon nigroviridis]|uniref:(spotted green pufferfish) hypothetical protein n=1 Tax=Tetraodon nigroviridis TaxID=99883 RepID=Q4SID2_TETNG|nr:unnamed protein product [Tetraodon nigroviridis]